jgi:tetratricopeptide (TPR) repeat protein
MTPSRRARALAVAMALAATLALGGSPEAHAEPDDDWSLERDNADPALVGQRFSKLRKNPFDRAQFRALEKAIGRDALAKRIESALVRDPDDVALGVLAARIAMARGKPADAAVKLAKLEAKAGRRAGAVFALRIDALEAAGDVAGAVKALRDRAAASPAKAKTALLSRALELADGAGQLDTAIELAQLAADAKPTDVGAQLRLARIASRAGDAARADRAFAAAERNAPARERDEIALERSRAMLAGGDPGAAASTIWSLLEDPKRGSSSNRAARWELLVDAHRQAGTAESLVVTLETWLAKHGSEAAAWRGLAAAQDLAGLESQVARRKAIALDPRDQDSQGALIDAMSTRGDLEGAIAEYRKYADRHPGDVDRGLALAASMLQGPDRDKGLALAREIGERTGRKPQALASLLEFYNLGDEPELALGVAKRLVKLAPRSAEAHIALGEQLYQMGRAPDAMTAWGHLPKLVRPAHRGWARHAEVLAEHGLVSDAVASLKVAMKLAPDEPDYMRLRAVFTEEQRRPAVAVELWEQLRLRATAPEHKLLRDEARTRVVELLVEGAFSGRVERAAAAENAARIAFERGEPLADAVEAGKFLGELHTRREHYASAVAVYRQLVRLQPTEGDRLAELAGAQRRAGQPAEAIATLEELLALDPSRKGDVLAEVSELAFEAGDDARALEAAHASAKASGRQVDALVRLGELHERRGDLDAAAAAYDEAMTAEPDDLRAYLHLAELEVTRTHDARARELLAAALDRGGSAELMRDAGRRLLDLAEADGSALDVLALALRRSSKQPKADEPRELLLSAIDRVDTPALRKWLADKPAEARATSMRASLLAAVERGPVSVRARAAGHLGTLRLPDTALALVRAAQSIAAPRDATATVRDAYERARVTTLRAAGAQGDPQANDALVRIMDDGSSSRPLVHAAAWGLVGTAAPEATWKDALTVGADPVLATLACVALAQSDKIGAATMSKVGTLARESRWVEVRHACALAEANLVPDKDLGSIAASRGVADPVLASIGAWRRGRVRDADDDVDVALFSAVLGPAGLERDAAAAALSRRLSKRTAVPRLDRPPPPSARAYGPVFERWLVTVVAPSFEPLDAAALSASRPAIRRAMAANAAGSRVEREALRKAQQPCRAHQRGRAARDPHASSARATPAPATSLCLAPLSDETVVIAPTGRD